MEIQIVLNCDQRFYRRARYVSTMLGLIAGFRPRFVRAHECDFDKPVIVYGASIKEKSCRYVLIPEDEHRLRFFHERMPKQPNEVKQLTLFEVPFLSLFHSIKDDIQTISSDCIVIPTDLISGAFYFLSLFEESIIDERDQFDRFEYKSSLLGKLNFSDRPVIAEYAEVLMRALSALRQRFDRMHRYDGKASAVCLTHDIDYLSKWSPGIAYQEIIKNFFLNQAKKSFPRRFNRLTYFLKCVSKRYDPYKVSLKKMIEQENLFGYKGTYFVKAGGNDKRDVTYSLRNTFLNERFDELISLENEIGIHPSFNTYLDGERWSNEINALSKVVKTTVRTSRQHYLRFRYPDTFRIMESNNIEFDSTLGFAEMNGFRNGMCHPFLPYDLENDRVMNLWEVPLHIMDGTLIDYRKLSADESFDEILKLKSIVSQHHGVYTILFHNIIYDKYTCAGWNEVFEKFLLTLSDENILATTIPKTVEAWYKSATYRTKEEIISLINHE